MAVTYRGRELVGVIEIAELLNLNPVVVHNWRRRYDDFPAPVIPLRSNAVWELRQIERFLQQHPRLRQVEDKSA